MPLLPEIQHHYVNYDNLNADSPLLSMPTINKKDWILKCNYKKITFQKGPLCPELYSKPIILNIVSLVDESIVAEIEEIPDIIEEKIEEEDKVEEDDQDINNNEEKNNSEDEGKNNEKINSEEDEKKINQIKSEGEEEKINQINSDGEEENNQINSEGKSEKDNNQKKEEKDKNK